jgi:hypothetical protein
MRYDSLLYHPKGLYSCVGKGLATHSFEGETAMAQHIRVGTKLDLGGDPLDTYVVERIYRVAGVLTLDVRTERQRCFDRGLTGTTSWTEAFIRSQVAEGAMQVR